MSSEQVGGNHYQSEYQHWDFVEEIKLGYLEANATKYLCRWRKKNGLEDLKKARSYVVKLMEQVTNRKRTNPVQYRNQAWNRFCNENGINGPERDACIYLCLWWRYEDLERIMVIINDIIFENFPEEFAAKMSSPDAIVVVGE